MNDEQRHIAALYWAESREATVAAIKDALPLVLLPELQKLMEETITGILAMSEEAFADMMLLESAEMEEV